MLTDLDALEEQDRQHLGHLASCRDIDMDTWRAMIAELRVSRKVVEAARKYQDAVDDSLGAGKVVDNFDKFQEALDDALVCYDRLTSGPVKEGE